MLNTFRKACFLSLLLLASPSYARAELVVVVNLQNNIEQLTKTQVTNIFLGNHREFPNGLQAKPLDLPPAQPEKASFYRTLVNRDLDQMAAYWARLVFAGNTAPPQQLPSPQEAMQYVANNRNAVAYMERKQIDPAQVKIVFSFP